MAKLIVEILDARDLLPTVDHGSASPFVEVDFNGRCQRTQTKTRDLCPSWNEKLVFDLQNPRNLHNFIIQVIVYDAHTVNLHMDFLGCVQISGGTVSLSESEATVRRYPLCKRGFFSHGRGDISLKIYTIRAQYYGNQQPHRRLNVKKAPKLEEISKHDHEKFKRGDKKTEEDNETRNVYSAGTSGGAAQVNDVFSEVWHSDSHGIVAHQNQPHRRLNVKKAPKLEEISKHDHEKFKRGDKKTEEGNETRNVYSAGTSGGAAQVNDVFSEVWHSDSHGIVAHQNLTNNTSSSVYLSPTLYYLRIGVTEAHHVAPFYQDRPPDFRVRLQLGDQTMLTRTSKVLDGNPVWNQEILLIASDPLDEILIINVVDRITLTKEEVIGRTVLPLSDIPIRFDSAEHLQPRCFNLNKVSSYEHGSNRNKQPKILLKVCLESGYHVSDCRHGDFQPTAKHLKKDRIGSLEVLILRARCLSPMKKQIDGGATTDAYCVVKYGNKWVRTKTIINSQKPCWNEEYAWEVYDPCTVIMIGVFDNQNVKISNKETRDLPLGKIFIPIQTLHVNRMHTQYYPLLFLYTSGLKNNGEIQVAVRFTGISWPNMVSLYTKPLLPKMHYLQPVSIMELDFARHRAVQIVAACLSKAEPPFKQEIVEYMLDEGSRMWSLRKQKANFERLMSFVLSITAVYRWFGEIRHWRNPLRTIFIHVLYLVLVWYPKLILPAFFLSLSMMGMWNYRFRPRNPPLADSRLSQAETTDLYDLDEEFDTFPTSRPVDLVKKRYDRLRSIAGRYQTVAGDIATFGEKAKAILNSTDLRATLIFTLIAFICAVFTYMASFKVVATLFGFYWFRPPRLRRKQPSLLLNLFNRLPSKMDVMIF